MSKPMTINTASLVAIIEEINESITAVTMSTIDHVITIVQDSIHEDCTWYGNPVTYDDIHAVVIDWIDENVEAEAPARIVEDVDASYDDDAIDEALYAIRVAIIAGQNATHLILKAQDLGATRHDISGVIIEAANSLA